ncbi:MAG: glycosyltransferase [Saprospiraceae bacterium]
MSLLVDLLTVTFLLATFIQLLYWLGIFSRLAFYSAPSPPKPNQALNGISIIICARNAESQLRQFLPKILAQKDLLFEVIVVNDHSIDNSEQIILDFQNNYPNLHLINESDTELPGKKKALSEGILAAKYEFLLLTDADCFPTTTLWAKSMANLFSEKDQVILGFSPYTREKSLINYFIRFETVYTATQYLSFALAGAPYMGVGRNLAYAKSLFINNQGFENHLHLASGDDDLFVNQVANYKNTKINLDAASFMYSIPKKSWKSYYYQKRRHLTTATSYRPVHQVLLALLAASHLWHYLGGLILFAVSPQSLHLILTSYLVRIGVVSFMYWRISTKLEQSDLRFWIPLLDLFYCLYYVLFAPGLFITGSNHKSWT